jgi:hypothetical protein
MIATSDCPTGEQPRRANRERPLPIQRTRQVGIAQTVSGPVFEDEDAWAGTADGLWAPRLRRRAARLRPQPPTVSSQSSIPGAARWLTAGLT